MFRQGNVRATDGAQEWNTSVTESGEGLLKTELFG